MNEENFRYEFSCNPICGKSLSVIIGDLEKIVEMLKNGKVTGTYPIWDVVDTLKIDTRGVQIEKMTLDTSNDEKNVNKPFYDNNKVYISDDVDDLRDSFTFDDFDGPVESDS
jgi:hypothetical protein